MSDADIEAKVRDLSAFGGAGCDIDRIIETAWRLDALAVCDFTRLLVAPDRPHRWILVLSPASSHPQSQSKLMDGPGRP
jgi:hypothetical protein